MLKGDNEVVIQFLKAFYPEGPWCLTSINPDRKGIETRTFTINDMEDLLSWLTYHNGRNNLYFHVNEVIGNLKSKAEREQIQRVWWLHVDIDPRAGKDIDGEQQRIQAALSPENIANLLLPQPTFVTFSGGGYQAFWRMETPWEVNGSIEEAEEVARYNKQLEILFGADNCHNIDRIMRLPGTVNIPTAKKRQAGRVPAVAKVIRHTDVAYAWESFTKAPRTTSDLGPNEKNVIDTSNIKRIEDLAELDEWGIQGDIKIIIAQGRHPDKVKPKDNSRSAWLWHVLCDLSRHGVPPAVQYALITDPNWSISESILELGRKADAEAKRQIARALIAAESEDLLKMNEEYFALMHEGKFRVCYWKQDPELGRRELQFSTLGDLRNYLKSKFVEIGKDKKGQPILSPLVDWWNEHPKRATFKGLTFAPNRPDVNGYYNLWQGFAVDAKPGDCSKFLDHCKNVLCRGNEEQFNYLMGWMARLVQEPNKPGQVAIVLKGERGAGKGTFAKHLGGIFGCHYMQVANSNHLVGNFNRHLRDLCLLFADEAFFAGDKKHESVLKTLITEPTIPIEAKGVDVTIAPNMIHLIMAANDAHVIPAGPMERRYFVLEVSDEFSGDSQNPKVRAYFDAINTEMENGGREALLHTLLNYDLSEFNVFAVPRTKELSTQQDLGLGPVEAWWLNKLIAGRIFSEDTDWNPVVMVSKLQEDYYTEMSITKQSRTNTRIQLGVHLHKLIPTIRQTKRDVDVKAISGEGYEYTKKLVRQPHYVFPDLTECRARWVKQYGPRVWEIND